MKSSLALKLSVWICGVLLLCFAVVGLVVLNKIHTSLGNTLDERALSVAAETASQLDKIFLQTRSMAQLLAEELELNSPAKAEMPLWLEKRLKSIHAECPDIIGMAVAYCPEMLDGKSEYNTWILLLNKAQYRLTHWNSAEIDYEKYLDWFLIPTTYEKPYWTSPFIAFTGTMISSYSVPFYRNINGERKLAGVVVLDYDVGTFVNYLKNLNIPETKSANQQCKTFLMNSFGKIVASQEKEQILNETLFSLCESSEELAPDDFENARKIFGFGQAGTIPASGKVNFSTTAILGAPCEFFYSRCLNNWMVAVAIPADWRSAVLLPFFTKVAIFTALLLFIIIMTIYSICKRVNRPLTRLSHAAQEVGKGNFNTTLPDFKSNDEIGILNDSFKKMQQELSDYILKLKDSISARERTEGELNAAKAIQQDILPHILPPFEEFANVSGAADLIAARGVGGDLYDVFPIDKNHLALIVGDVSGKGVPAALFMAVTQTLQRNIAQHEHGAAELVNKLNIMLSANNQSNMFVTYWLGILNIRNGMLSYVNGGHNPPIIKNTDGSITILTDRHGPPLGIVPSKKFKSSEIRLNDGDTLICYTDGVTEAFNNYGKMFGDKRLFSTIEANKSHKPKDLLNQIKQSVFDFTDGAEQSDDITLLVMQLQMLKSLNVPSETGQLENVLKFARQHPEFAKLPPKSQNQLEVVLEEIFANIVNYAYSPEPGLVFIDIFTDDNLLKIRFSDEGKPYNPLEKPDPDITLTAGERQIGGLGIFIIKKNTDFAEYKYFEGKNIFTIGKKMENAE